MCNAARKALESKIKQYNDFIDEFESQVANYKGLIEQINKTMELYKKERAEFLAAVIVLEEYKHGRK